MHIYVYVYYQLKSTYHANMNICMYINTYINTEKSLFS
jgi:hypothetical protein